MDEISAIRIANFYPRSPCGERPNWKLFSSVLILFLSTLSLRRATKGENNNEHESNISIHALLAESDRSPETKKTNSFYFYPRSPCGERLHNMENADGSTGISIHALLAESDPSILGQRCLSPYFYPRSPCGERQC